MSIDDCAISNGCNCGLLSCRKCKGRKISSFSTGTVISSGTRFTAVNGSGSATENINFTFETLLNAILANVPVAPTGPFLKTEDAAAQTVLGPVEFFSTVTFPTGSIFLGESGYKLSAASRVMQLTDAFGRFAVAPFQTYDDTGSQRIQSFDFGPLIQFPTAIVGDETLSGNLDSTITSTLLSFSTAVMLTPESAGNLRIQSWAGSTPGSGPVLSDTIFTVTDGDIGQVTTFVFDNPSMVETGDTQSIRYSGVDLRGGLQADGPFVGQTVPQQQSLLFLPTAADVATLDDVLIGTPLSTTVYVDPATTVDIADRNGAEGAPFISIDEAYANITPSALTPYVIRLTPADYTGPITSLAHASLSAIGDSDNTTISGQITIDTAGHHGVKGVELLGSIDISVAGLGVTSIHIEGVEVLNSLLCVGDGAGNTALRVRDSQISNQVSVTNASANYGACSIDGIWSVTGDAGTLDGDGNAASLIAGACRFKGATVSIDGPLQTRAFFFSCVIEGAMTCNDALTSVTFDSNSHPQTLTLNGGAQRFLSSFASGTQFDPSFSPLSSDTVQDAIDELANAPGTPLQRLILLMASSTAVSQEPSTTDDPLQIEFGPAQALTEFDIAVDGAITCNVTGQYDFQLVFHTGRSGTASFSDLYIRLLINGTQLGESAHTKIDDDDTIVPLEFFAHLTLVATDIVTMEIVRDSSGNDSGGLFQGDPTLGDWNKAETAMVLITQLRGEVIGSDGDVTGPVSSIDDEITTFLGTTGKTIQAQSGVTVNSGTIQRTTTNADLNILRNGLGKIQLGNGSTNAEFGASNAIGATTFGVASPLGFSATIDYEHDGALAGRSGYEFVSDTINIKDTITNKGIYIQTQANGEQISIGLNEMEPQFSVTIAGDEKPFGLPLLTTANEAALTGQPRMIHYNSILDTIRFWSNTDNEFQTLIAAPNLSTANAVATYTDATGRKLKATSNVRIQLGVIKRIDNDQDLIIEQSGTGKINIGNSLIIDGQSIDSVDGQVSMLVPIVTVSLNQTQIDSKSDTAGELINNTTTGTLQQFGVNTPGTGHVDVGNVMATSISHTNNRVPVFNGTRAQVKQSDFLMDGDTLTVTAGTMSIEAASGFTLNLGAANDIRISATGGVGIAGLPSSDELSIDLTETDKAMRLNVVENAEQNALTPAPGWFLYSNASSRLEWYNGVTWRQVAHLGDVPAYSRGFISTRNNGGSTNLGGMVGSLTPVVAINIVPSTTGLINFTDIGGGVIRYTGSSTFQGVLVISCSWVTGSAAQAEYGLYPSINGIIDEGVETRWSSSGAIGIPSNCTLSYPVELSTNDTIEPGAIRQVSGTAENPSCRTIQVSISN